MRWNPFSKKGQPYGGVVVRVNDPKLVKWPGWYGVRADGSVDRRCRVEGNHADGWVRV